MRKCCDSCLCKPHALWTKACVWNGEYIIQAYRLSLFHSLLHLQYHPKSPVSVTGGEKSQFPWTSGHNHVFRLVVLGEAHGWDGDYIRDEEEQSRITWPYKPPCVDTSCSCRGESFLSDTLTVVWLCVRWMLPPVGVYIRKYTETFSILQMRHYKSCKTFITQ